MRFAFARSKDPVASASYLSHYQLTTPPFAVSAEGPFLYLDAERQQSLDMLQHLTQYSEEVLLVTGESGAGKTTLCKQFLQRSEEHWRCCLLDASPSLDTGSLFTRLAECFELRLGHLPPDQLLAGMQSQLNAMQEQRLAVLLVDDAQALSDDLLEIILHLGQLEGEHAKLIRLVMFSEPEIAIRLAEPRFSALPPAHRIELKGLGEQETVAYITQRLRAAGLQGQLPFDLRELRQIHRASEGKPGAINQQANQILQQKSRQGQSLLSRQGLKLGIAAMAIAGTVLGLHGRVYEYVMGEGQTSALTAERPVVRLTEQAQPWAVVIRDGESIQISCGVTGEDTVGVRPTFSAAALGEIERPLLVSEPPMVADDPGTETRQTEDEPIRHPETIVAASQEPVATPEPQPVRPPEEPEEEVPAAAAEPVAVVLDRVEPSPVEIAAQPQRILVHGQGMLAGSRIAMSRAGQIEVLDETRIEYIDEQTIALSIETGAQPAAWAVQLSTPDNRRSNVLRFQVVASTPSSAEIPVPQPESASELAVVEPAPLADSTVPAGEEAEPAPLPLVAPAIRQEDRAEVAAPQPARDPVPEPEVEAASVSATPTPVAPRPPAPVTTRPSPVISAALRDTQWLAEQPPGNFTVQLLASGQQENIQRLARDPALQAPLAAYMAMRDGQSLYVLTQGSYANRAEAERAAARVPAGLQPWVRSIASVQEVMRELPAAATAASRSAAASGGDIPVANDAWVWSQNPANYTIQLSGASTDQAIMDAMHGMDLPNGRVVVRTMRDGRPWYVLILGSFTSSEAARAQINQLPAAIRRLNPWPRSFASLHDDMSRAGARP